MGLINLCQGVRELYTQDFLAVLYSYSYIYLSPTLSPTLLQALCNAFELFKIIGDPIDHSFLICISVIVNFIIDQMLGDLG